ncbi:MAG: serine hydrolase [Candidatus Taylorbacteria bacterium]|nr:serine hydrolase [Candidatus Taylorbacteria bacterium]
MKISEKMAQVVEPFPTPAHREIVSIDPGILIDDYKNPIKPVPTATAPKPYIRAESYLVGNLETGEIYIDLNSSKAYPIASVSKLYTALVVHHLFDLEKDIVIDQSMLDAYGDGSHLSLGEKFKPNDLLYALLLESSNDAAEAFARSFGYVNFMNEMNAFAKEIGMHNTYFKDASGLSPHNISSAEDLFTFSKYLYKSEKDILEISRTKEMDFATTTDHGFHHFVNINPFAAYGEFYGGKTGRTNEAKEAMVSLFNKKVVDKEYPLVVIVLRSDFGQREIDTEKLLGLFMDKVSP